MSNDRDLPSQNQENGSLTGSELSIGTTLGDYEVKSLLGSGGMGAVYRARDCRLRREVAIKVLLRDQYSDVSRRHRFEVEARAAAALNHPNILAIFHFGIYQDAPYIVSELLEGETLRARLNRGAIPTGKAVELAVQIARGLAAAHAKGVLHRDLKPENIFLTSNGLIKIIDFGVAKVSEPTAQEASTTIAVDTLPGTVLGTPGYISPEQIRGHAIDQRSDIFAFGSIFYEMLTGRRAYQGQTFAETLGAILTEDPLGDTSALSNLSLGLQRLLGRTLEKDPEQRFHSASDLAFALESLSEAAPATAIPDTRRSRTRRIWLAIAATAVFGTGLFIGILGAGRNPQIDSVTPLTNDGQTKEVGSLVTDGSRLYFNEGKTGNWQIAQVSVAGGVTGIIGTKLRNPQIAALTSDGSELLVLVGGSNDPLYPLWSVPLPAGDARRLGTLEAQDASFLPDGRILFTAGPRLYVSERDASHPRLLTDGNAALITSPSVSPDGREIGFTAFRQASSGTREPDLLKSSAGGGRLETVSSDGSGFHNVPIAGNSLPSCCGKWTPDGKHLVFQSMWNTRSDLWTVSTGKSLWPYRVATRLTSGPLSYSSPILSRDGRQIFAIGSQKRGELVRFDLLSRNFLPYLSGLSATDPTFSADGRRVSYVSYPERALWSSDVDGQHPSQLTYPPVIPVLPFMSPDGTKVSFSTTDNAAYVVTEDGATKLISRDGVGADWSPDSKTLIVTSGVAGMRAGKKNSVALRTINLANGREAAVPDSTGKLGALWLTADTIMAASEDTSKLWLFKFSTQKWTELAAGHFVNWAIAPDKKLLYCTTSDITGKKLLRIRFGDNQWETIADLKDFREVVNTDFGTAVDVAPDESPLFTRDIGTDEIYALNVRWR